MAAGTAPRHHQPLQPSEGTHEDASASENIPVCFPFNQPGMGQIEGNGPAGDRDSTRLSSSGDISVTSSCHRRGRKGPRL